MRTCVPIKAHLHQSLSAGGIVCTHIAWESVVATECRSIARG